MTERDVVEVMYQLPMYKNHKAGIAMAIKTRTLITQDVNCGMWPLDTGTAAFAPRTRHSRTLHFILEHTYPSASIYACIC